MLLGVTGSGKTFTMAKVIEAVQKPTLILAPNKTLAAQLYGEMKGFFPDNAVEYLSATTTTTNLRRTCRARTRYIEKDAQINEQIDRMRHSATQSLLERNDVVIVASVSCIDGIGLVEDVRENGREVGSRGPDRPRQAGEGAGGTAIPPQRPGVPARHVPAARRDRGLPEPLRRPRLARDAVRRRDRADRRIRPADRRGDGAA